MSYHEEHKVTWVWVLMIVNIVCVVVFLLMVRFYAIHGASAHVGLMLSMLTICGFITVLLATVTYAFSGYQVVLDDDRLTFGFRFWKKSLLVSHIAQAEKEPSPGLWSGGFGWRIDLAGRYGYIASGGDAVFITTKARRKYVFSCQNPDRLLEALRSVSPNTKA